MRGNPSPLIEAIHRGNLLEAIAALENGCDVEEQDLHQLPGLPLRAACFHGHQAIVSELLKRGADVRSPNHEGPNAPLRLAIRGKRREVVELLLEHGAEVPPGVDLHEATPADSGEGGQEGKEPLLNEATPPSDRSESGGDGAAPEAQPLPDLPPLEFEFTWNGKK